jgi:hypothetical protein
MMLTKTSQKRNKRNLFPSKEKGKLLIMKQPEKVHPKTRKREKLQRINLKRLLI